MWKLLAQENDNKFYWKWDFWDLKILRMRNYGIKTRFLFWKSIFKDVHDDGYSNTWGLKMSIGGCPCKSKSHMWAWDASGIVLWVLLRLVWRNHSFSSMLKVLARCSSILSSIWKLNWSPFQFYNTSAKSNGRWWANIWR